MQIKNKRGGKRPGSGRKPDGRKNYTFRIMEGLPERVREKLTGRGEIDRFIEGALNELLADPTSHQPDPA